MRRTESSSSTTELFRCRKKKSAWFRRAHRSDSTRQRQQDAERSPNINLTLHSDVTTALSYDAMHDQSPRARPLPIGLVVKNGSKDFGLDFRGHTAARIGDCQLRIISWRHYTGLRLCTDWN